MINMHQWDGATARSVADTRLTGLVRQFIGEQPVINQTMLYFKPPGARGQAMHQDQQYIAIDPLIGVWIALEDSDEANGQLMLVPGSHQLPVLPVQHADQAVSSTRGQASIPSSCPLPVGIDMKPGDAVFFSGRTLHGSAPNATADRFRRSLICHYVGQRANISRPSVERTCATSLSNEPVVIGFFLMAACRRRGKLRVMELTLAILIAFVLACVAWPQLSRSRPHFIVGVIAVALAMFFHTMGFHLLSGLSQIAALILFVVAGSGMGLAQWGRAVIGSFREL